MTEEEVYQLFLAAIDRAGGQRPFAKRIGVTPSYVNDVVNKRRLMSDRILATIGIERIITVTYQPVVTSVVTPGVDQPPLDANAPQPDAE